MFPDEYAVEWRLRTWNGDRQMSNVIQPFRQKYTRR